MPHSISAVSRRAPATRRMPHEERLDSLSRTPTMLYFVDPYGFKIPAGLLGDLMKAGRVELVINVMWRELDMLVQQRPAPGTRTRRRSTKSSAPAPGARK
jgi:hypothetical protein